MPVSSNSLRESQGRNLRRAAAVISALRRLEILQRETVVLTMPEILPLD